MIGIGTLRVDRKNGKVTFEVDSTQLEDYLLIFDLVTELWLGKIMSSENAIFVKKKKTLFLVSEAVSNNYTIVYTLLALFLLNNGTFESSLSSWGWGYY